MKRFSYTRVAFAIAAAALLVVGMLRDPDLSNADGIGEQPVAHDRMPGYQLISGASKHAPLKKDELARLNAQVTEPAATF